MKLTMVVPDVPAALNQAMEGLVRVSAAMLLAAIRSGRPVPPLYTMGARYQREPGAREWWQTVADNVAEKRADCEDLATHRAAELRVGPVLLFPQLVAALQAYGVESPVGNAIVGGELYPARAVCIRTGRKTYHAIVRHPDGHYEDPSRALGMRAAPFWLQYPSKRRP